jgi:urea carboxylase-associated protein 2
MSSTADPKAARRHARSMEGTVVEAMPTVPARRAADRPPGVPAEDMIWEETLAAGGYAARRLARGARLRLVDTHGDACASMLVFNSELPTERLNVADTVKVQWNAYPGAGAMLLSDMGRVLMSVLEDGAGTHDSFCGASNAQDNARRYGSGDNWGPHPNARDRFLLGAAKFGLGRRDIHPCLNWFKGVRIAADGSVRLDHGPFVPGRALTLRADMDLIVVLANCPHPLDPRPDFCVTPVRVSAWRGAPAADDDPVRCAGPEAQRAFWNTDEFLQR